MSYDSTQNPTPEYGTNDSAAADPSTNKLAIGGFVCGPVDAVTAFIPDAGALGFPVLAVGLVLSAIGLARGTLHRGLAVAGLVVALVALPVDAAATGAPLISGTSMNSTSNAGTPDTSSSTTSTSGVGGSGYASGSYSSGSSGYPAAGSYSSPSSSGTSSGYSAADQAYLETLSRYGVTGGSDAQAISLGHSVCSYLSRGGTTTGATDVITDNGFSSTEASVIVGAAEGAYCSN